MSDRDKVIKAIEACIDHDHPPCCRECYLDGPGFGIACREKLMRDALALLREQEAVEPTVGGWISVKEQLPEDGADVLVWESQSFAYCDKRVNGMWNIGANNGAIITHWMPLPEPPKNNGEE